MRYLHLDVFTDRPFEGNQLAVFPEPGDASTGLMQTITREMNFSECTFIFPPEGDGDVRMRIFTPDSELPMAGHPTIGSTFALAEEGVIAPERETFVFELGVGPTPVSLEWDADRLAFAWMTQPLPGFGDIIEDRSGLAAAVGVDAPDLLDQPIQVVSCGVPFLFVPLVTRGAVDSVSVDRRALARVLRDAGLDELPTFVFTPDRTGASGDETVYSRMLAPGFGIAEDPATGGASGPLGCYLLRHGLVTGDHARSLLSLQGVAMQRPSRIHISIESRGGEIARVRVGGKSVLVGTGEIATAPDLQLPSPGPR
ncbi:MAG: PhzF family phenazine biosynthesis protein [Acidobacteria bacterium]|nr:PhzF family phenazine biosynthesis protein [Acidobacteriota bacterium]